MTRYHVRIDGEILPDTYTYEELLLNSILDFDDIELKPMSHSVWVKVIDFNFPEENDSFSIGDDGTVTFTSVSAHLNSGTSSSQNSSSYSNFTTPRQAINSNVSSSTASDDDNIGYKILFTIIILVIAIVLCCMGIFGVIVGILGGGYVLGMIWLGD